MQQSKVYSYLTEGFARLVKYLRVIFLAKFCLAGILAIFSPFLGIWIATAGAMTACLAGGAYFSGYVIKLSAEANANYFRPHKTKLLGTIVTFRVPRIRSRARSYRRSASNKTSVNGGNSSDGGESDPGDPPDPDHPSIPTHHFLLAHLKTFLKNRETNSSESLRHILRSLGCCHLPSIRHIHIEEATA